MKRFPTVQKGIQQIYCPTHSFYKELLAIVFLGMTLLLPGCRAASFLHHPHLLPRSQVAATLPAPVPPSVPIAQTLLAYCQALTFDNIPSAFAQLDPATQHVVTEAAFDAQLDHFVLGHHGLRGCQPLAPIAVYQGNDAHVALLFQHGDGSQDKLGLALLKEDHQWKILFTGFVCTLTPGAQNLQVPPCCIVASLRVLFPYACLHQGDEVTSA